MGSGAGGEGALLLIAVGLAFDFGLSSSSLDLDLSRMLFGELCGVKPRGERERSLGVAGGVLSGVLSFILLSLGSPRFGIIRG